MNWIQQFIPTQLIDILGWTLIHSLWQGASLAILLATALIFLRRNSSRVRYFIAISALFTLTLATTITFVSLYQSESYQTQISTFTQTTPSIASGKSGLSLLRSITIGSQGQLAFFSDYFNQHLPLIVTVWLLGVLVLMLRFLGGFAYLQRLRHHQVASVSKDWQVKTLEIADQLKIKKIVRLFESAMVKTPMIIGHLKPIILLPLGTISGLGSKQIESILAHELAHITRNDYLVNILQSIVEIFLFFNPAMWWISARIREERENCCDDIALQLTNDRLTLVKTLATLEEMRISSPQAAVAFVGKKGGLVGRIRRIVNSPRTNATFSEGFVAAILLIGFLFLASFYVHTKQAPVPVKSKAHHTLTTKEKQISEQTQKPSRSQAKIQTKPDIRAIKKPLAKQVIKPMKKTEDTIRFGKFVIITHPRGQVAVYKSGKKIDPDDYEKYEKYFAINSKEIRIGKKNQSPITIKVDPQKSYTNIYDYHSDDNGIPLPPSMPPLPPTSNFGVHDYDYSKNEVRTWVEDDGKKQIEIKFRNGSVVKLKIDGKVIPPNKYSKYRKQINKARKLSSRSSYHQDYSDFQHQRRRMQRRNLEMQRRAQSLQRQRNREMERFHNQSRRRQRGWNTHNRHMIELNAIINKMKDDGIIPKETRNYKLSIQNNYIKINGKKLNKRQYKEYRQYILELTGTDIAQKDSSWSWTSTHEED